jgi:hypothetical protein
MELRRTADGTVITELLTQFPETNIIFSPDVARYRAGLFGAKPMAEFELRRTQDGGLLATLGGDLAGDSMTATGDLNFDLNYSSNGKHGVSFSPDGSTIIVRYASGRGELWDTRGTPRRLADLGLGLAKSGFVFTREVERLAVQYGNSQLYLLDIAWLRRMGGDPRQLPAKELVRLACEGPLTSGPWTEAEQAALDDALDGRKPQSCSFADTPNKHNK